MWRWVPLVLLLFMSTASHAQQETGGQRVLVDAPVVVLPGMGGNLQCLSLDGGTLVIAAQRTGFGPAGPYPVTLTVSPLVPVPSFMSPMGVTDMLQSVAVTLPSPGVYCYGLQHAQPGVVGPESAPFAQFVALRLSLGPSAR